ncbi:MAG: response regulator [Dechloromonas sp.]|uniref:Virulence sensor protein BvgS n=1 Tax=Candidatus Dechloromonas phosphorivorans TaxID=2899244 RepID=A0A935MRY9_9RHOO|nr:response regulator [Candidatus Dechloromonas phosphorivorans]
MPSPVTPYLAGTDETPEQLRASRDAAILAAQLAMRDTTRLMRLLTILGTPLPLDALLDRALATLSELFAADIVILLDPGGTGSFIPTAAVGLPEDILGHAFADTEYGYVAQVLRTGLAIDRNDGGTDQAIDANLREQGAEAIVWVPVNGSHGTRGVLILARCRPAPFVRDDVGMLTAMGYRLGIALEQAQRRDQMEIMAHSGQQIGCHLDVSSVAFEAVRIFPSVVGADAAVLVLTDESGQTGMIERGQMPPSLDPIWRRLTDAYLISAQAKDWFLSTPSLAAELIKTSLSMPLECAVHSMLAVPIRHQDRPQGILFGLRFVASNFPPDTHQVAILFAGQTSSSLENARLCQALRDELGERLRLENELRQSKRTVEQLLDTRTLQLDAAHVELWAQKQEYEELYNTAPCGYHSLDADGTFQRVNTTEQQMLGYSAQELVGKMKLSDVIAPHGQHLLVEHWQSLMQQGHLNEQRLDFLRRDGTIFPGALNGFVVRDEQGKFVSMRSVLFDDSERLARERQISALNIELEKRAVAAEAANYAKSRFLATMSHEFRTPLNAIMGFTSILKMRGAQPEQKQKLEKISTASAQLLEILNDVLVVAQADVSGKMALNNTDFDFDALLRSIVEPIEIKANSKGLAFNLEMGLIPRTLHGDANRLGEILSKLLTNAVKFTEHGSILLRGRVVEAGALDVMLRFEVQDSGIGIPPEIGERVFEAFEQGDNSSTRNFGGTGLGLNIVRSQARLMGGDVGFVSTPCVGSTFWVTVALAKAHVDHPPETIAVADAKAALQRGFAGTRVLVVEDDLINQELLVELLNNVGLVHDLAEDGLVAIEKAIQQPYPLILMDMKMPGMDGLDATREIRRLPGYAKVPITAVTGNAMQEDRELCLQAGMNDYLAKPINPDLLFAKLYKWLTAAQQH